MNNNRNPLPGENVLFVLNNGEARPATIITTNTDKRCSMHVFALGDDSDRKYFENPIVKNVEFNENKVPGTYYWPAREGEQAKAATSSNR